MTNTHADFCKSEIKTLVEYFSVCSVFVHIRAVHEQSIIVLMSLHIIYELHFPTGKLSMVEQLVKAGANVNSVMDNGYPLLEYTISQCMN